MDNKIKQRVLGGIVIGAIVIITIPFFFGHNHQTVPTKTVTMNALIPPLATSLSTPASTLPPTPTVTAQPETTPAPAAQNTSAPNSSNSATTDQTIPLVVTDEQTQTTPTVDTTEQNSAPTDVNSSTSTTTQPAFDPNAAGTTPATVPAPTPTTTPAFNPQATPAVAQMPVTTPAPQPAVAAPVQPEPQVATTATTPVKIKSTPVTQHTSAVSNTSHAWTVQVGSFSKKSNAAHLVSQLKARGLPAYTQTIQSSHGKTIRVFVGPEVKHAKAQALVVLLERRNHIQAIIVPYSTSIG